MDRGRRRNVRDHADGGDDEGKREVEMARVYRTKHGYGIDYRFPPTRRGRRIREFIGPNKDEAKIILGERIKAIRLGKNPELRKVQPKPFKETVTEFLEKHARLR